MSIGLIGKKQGMTRFFTEEGKGVAVTVVSIEPNTITQIKTKDNEGYSSIQVTTGKKSDKHLTKPLLGHYKKSSTAPGEGLWEFRTSEEEIKELEVGNSIGLDKFENNEYVDVSGISKGKGFAGTVKDGTLACKMLHTGTHYHTELQDPLVSARHLEEYGKEKKCLDIWVIKGKQPRT